MLNQTSSSQRGSGLRQPASRISRPSGVVKPPSGSSSNNSRAQTAIERSARAAGLTANAAERYAINLLDHLPGPEPGPKPPTDGYQIGDRVWIAGNRPGAIAFIGETQFSPGEWAGIVLSGPTGKNDGSVAGIRYFQCESKCGVFSRLSKLSRYPIDNTVSINAGIGANSHVNATSKHMADPLLFKQPVHPQLSSTISNIANHAPSAAAAANPASLSSNSLKVNTLFRGDSIIVSGTKKGTLRYLGTTDFAKGEWAGVELLEPSGKNDGAVAGKRYFSCKQNHGLFAPKSKVVKIASAKVVPSQATGIVTSPRRMSIGMRSRSGSIESISSIGSAMSSMSTRSARQSAASERLSKGRPSLTNNSVGTLALQKALKEKEEHIDQLLRERGQEREDMMAMNERHKKLEFSEMQNEFKEMKGKYEDKIVELHAIINGVKTERTELQDELRDEKRKVENISFTLDEKKIVDEDTEKQLEGQLQKMQIDLKDSKTEITNLKIELSKVNANTKDSPQSTIEQSLTEKVKQMQETIDNYKKQVEKAETENKRLIEMETLLKKSKLNQAVLQDKIIAVENTIINERETHTNDIKTIADKVAEQEENVKTQNELNVKLTDKNNQLEKEVTDALTSGGNQDEQMRSLRDKVVDKERELQESRRDLESSKQELVSFRSSVSEKNTDDLDLRTRLAEEARAQHIKVIGDMESAAEKLRLASELDLTNKCEELASCDVERERSSISLKEKDQELISLKDEMIESSRRIAELETEATVFITKMKDSDSNSVLINNKLIESDKKSEELTKTIEELTKTSEVELSRLKAQLLSDNEDNKTKADSNLSSIAEKHKSLDIEKDALITSLKQNLLNAENNNESLSTKCDMIDAKFDEVQKSNKEIINNYNECEAKLKISNEKLQQFTEKNNDLVSRIEDLMKNTGDSCEQLNLLNNKLITTEKSLMEAQDLQSSTKCEFEKQLTNKDNELNTLLADHAGKIENIEQKREATIKEKDMAIDDVNNKLNENIKLIAENESIVKELTDNLDCEKKENEIKERKLKDSEIKLSLYYDNEASLKEKQELLDERFNELSIELENKESELCLIRDQLLSTETELTDSKDSSTNTKGHLEGELKALLIALETAKSDNQITLTKMTNSHTDLINDKVNEIQLLNTEVNKLKSDNLENISNIEKENKSSGDEKDIFIEKLKSELTESNTAIANSKKSLEKAEEELFQVIEEMTSMKTVSKCDDEKSSGEINKLNAELEAVKTLLMDKDERYMKLEQELVSFKENKESLNIVNQENILKLDNSDKQIDIYKSQVLEAKERVGKLQSICEQQTLQNEKERQECNSWSESFKGIKEELETVMPKFLELQEKLKMSELESDDLRVLVKESASQINQYDKISEDKNILLEKISALQTAHTSKEHNFICEADNLRIELKENKDNLSLKTDHISSLQKEISELKKSSINVKKNSSNNNSNDEAMQIEFLNTVIADCKKKNDALQEKLDILNNIPDLNNSSFIDIESIRSTTSMRMFCDICELFDKHDTEDCPTQCNDSDVENSHHQGDRNAERPYCTSCEVFGHTNDTCDDEETF